MTISKRTLTTQTVDSEGRIQVMEYKQVVELVTDSMGSEYTRIIESIPNAGVIDPSMGDYDAKVKALGERVNGQLAASQESKIRNTEKQRDDKTGECVEHEERIATLEKVVAEQEKTIASLQKEVPDVRP